jgi:hypothetical protein
MKKSRRVTRRTEADPPRSEVADEIDVDRYRKPDDRDSHIVRCDRRKAPSVMDATHAIDMALRRSLKSHSRKVISEKLLFVMASKPSRKMPSPTRHRVRDIAHETSRTRHRAQESRTRHRVRDMGILLNFKSVSPDWKRADYWISDASWGHAGRRAPISGYFLAAPHRTAPHRTAALARHRTALARHRTRTALAPHSHHRTRIALAPPHSHRTRTALAPHRTALAPHSHRTRTTALASHSHRAGTAPHRTGAAPHSHRTRTTALAPHSHRAGTAPRRGNQLSA